MKTSFLPTESEMTRVTETEVHFCSIKDIKVSL